MKGNIKMKTSSHIIKKFTTIIILLFLVTLIGLREKFKHEKTYISNTPYTASDFSFKVTPENLGIKVKIGNDNFNFPGGNNSQVSQVQIKDTSATWIYSEKKTKVSVTKKKDYLEIKYDLLNQSANNLSLPQLWGDEYFLPIGEGKRIPANNSSWKKYFEENQNMSMTETLSMSFLSATQKNIAATLIMENNYNKSLEMISHDHTMGFQINTENSPNNQKSYVYRVYFSKPDPTNIAKVYKQYKMENHEFKSLVDKEAVNPNVKKMLGAPHFYFWQSRILTLTDINWNKLRTQTECDIFKHMTSLLNKYSEDGGEAFQGALNSLKDGEAYEYEKNIILNGMNNTLAYPDFYHPDIFSNLNKEDLNFLNETQMDIPSEKRFTINKKLLKKALQDSLSQLESWGQSRSTDVIKDMKKNGINKAWIGLSNWNQGLINPQFIQEAKKSGYAIGPYDSYQSIHENPSLDWNTASFHNNQDVFDNKTIMNKYGEYIPGFLGKGRKVNQTLIDNETKYRLQHILTPNIPYNSWFLDTDGAGEIYDDFNPQHPTSIIQDIKARKDRASMLMNKGLIVGTETGNDYFSDSMVFAHGIETPVIAWSDPDMRENKDSPYYVGGYASMDDGIPERYGKPIPIKPEYHTLYTSPEFSIPLYKLVYNDSVITSHHWEWGSAKIKGEESDRRIKEYLYNTPPLLHLNKELWDTNKEDIIKNSRNWEKFQEQAIKSEMTEFSYIDNNPLFQKTAFGSKLYVIANFTNNVQLYNKHKILPHTALIMNNGEATTIS